MSAFRDRLSRVRWKRLVLVGGGAGTLLLLLGVGVGYAATDVPEPSEVATGQSTVIRYADGGDIAVLGKNRVSVTLDKIPDHVQKAVLAAEDRGFYTEPGISPKGIARALLTNIRGGGGIQQGGSTITQQYAKNAFLSSERTYTRKVKEVFIALKMSRTVEKDQILEDYLNTIYFGRGADGIQVASQTYFGKDVSKLTVAEGAVLASVIRSPANYDPVKKRERAQDRFNYVLDGMVEKGWLDASQRGVPFPAVRKPGTGNKVNDLSGPKGHVVNQVLEELEREGIPESQAVAGGYVITTTLRRAAQDAAVAAVQDAVGDGKDEKALQGALVSVEPGTGKVIAYYGGGTGTGFDYANQGVGRQAGSTFKAYVLAAALEQGISLKSRFDGSSPRRFGSATVDNFGNEDFGPVDLLLATQKSVNTAFFELGLEVGPAKVADLAKRAGVTAPLGDGRPNGGIAIGGYEVNVLDQAVGYASFADRGREADAYFVQKVADRKGRSVYNAKPSSREAFSEDVAADATFALARVVGPGGTGQRAQLADGRPAAGKTGTSSDNKDAWFVGYVPQISTAVWLGYATPKKIRIDGVDATGGGFSTRIWKAYMDVAVKGLPVEQFPPRADLGTAQDPAPSSDTPSASPTSSSPSPSVTPSGLPSEVPSLVPTLEPTKKPPGKPSPSPSGGPSSPPPPESPPATQAPAAQPSPTP